MSQSAFFGHVSKIDCEYPRWGPCVFVDVLVFATPAARGESLSLFVNRNKGVQSASGKELGIICAGGFDYRRDERLFQPHSLISEYAAKSVFSFFHGNHPTVLPPCFLPDPVMHSVLKLDVGIFPKASLLVLFQLTCCIQVFANSDDPASALPREKRDAMITSPAEFFGFRIGSRHLRHQQVCDYMKLLASESERVSLAPYATSHGGRQLFVLVITSPNNQAELAKIKKTHRELASGLRKVVRDEDRSVMYLGYGVHGDEASAMNASPLVAYHLASSLSASVLKSLERSVFLLDPSLNPDGGSRFAHWVNENRGMHASQDPSDREHQQDWPGGRTNYYWFDLNRDWLPATHPESRGRIQLFHEWKPNVVLDFHEMGSSSSYFFQPGIPARTNPLTPDRNVQLTKLFAGFYATKMDNAGELFFTEEKFDDFYIGKGSTYPDVNGAVGILFEQGSTRGLRMKNSRFERIFSDCVANQVRTSLASIEALAEYSESVLQLQCDFFNNALTTGRDSKSFLLTGEASRISAAKELLALHDIKTYQPPDVAVVQDTVRVPSEVLLVDSGQPQYTMIKSLMTREKTFRENIFYDVSTWHLPSAFGLEVEEIDAQETGQLLAVFKPGERGQRRTRIAFDAKALGYAVPPETLDFPKLVALLQTRSAKLRVITKPVSIRALEGVAKLPQGTLLILRQPNLESWESIRDCLQQFAASSECQVYPLNSSQTLQGPDLGSDTSLDLPIAHPALVVGAGTNAYTAGALWHHLDIRMEQPTTLLKTTTFGNVDLDDYNVLILPDGSYNLWGQAQAKKLKRYLEDGGVVVAVCNSLSWLTANEVVDLGKSESKSEEKEEKDSDTLERTGFSEKRFGNAREDAALKSIAGAIFEVSIDSTHPLAYGFPNESVPVFRRGTYHYQRPENSYQTAGIYGDVIAGYVNEQNAEELQGTAAVFVVPVGRGRVIVLADNPVFRGYMRATEPFFTNAIYLGPSIRLPRSTTDEHE